MTRKQWFSASARDAERRGLAFPRGAWERETSIEDRSIPRIALLFEFGTLHGGERSMLAMLDQLAAGGDSRGPFEFVALAPEGGPLADALRQRSIQHVPLELRDERSRLPRERVCSQLAAAVHAVRPDLVHANSLSMGRLTGAVAPELSVPCVAHLRDILRLSGAAVADLNRNRLLLAVSEATRAFHVGQGIEPGRVRVLYNGVDCRRFQPRPRTGDLIRELGLPDGAFLVLTIGQIGLRKGQDVLADAAVRIVGRLSKPSGPVPAQYGEDGLESRPTKQPETAPAADRLPNAHYLLVGERHSAKAESIAFERAVIERFERAGLGGRLHRLGRREDVPRLMNECDLLVHPAHQEPLGRVLLEAGASGLPVLATAVGGTAEIFRDGESARLVPPGDPAELAMALAELTTNPAQCRQFAAAARRRIVESFDVPQAAQALAGLWQETIRTSPERSHPD